MNSAIVSFHSHKIPTVLHENQPHVALKPICAAMGISYTRQAEKVRSSPSRFNCTHKGIVASDGKEREMLCIPLRKLNGWLFSLNPNRVKPEIRRVVELYQDECFEVLYSYWHQASGLRPDHPANVLSRREASRAADLINKGLPSKEDTGTTEAMSDMYACCARTLLPRELHLLITDMFVAMHPEDRAQFSRRIAGHCMTTLDRTAVL